MRDSHLGRWLEDVSESLTELFSTDVAEHSLQLKLNTLMASFPWLAEQLHNLDPVTSRPPHSPLPSEADVLTLTTGASSASPFRLGAPISQQA